MREGVCTLMCVVKLRSVCELINVLSELQFISLEHELINCKLFAFTSSSSFAITLF